MYLVDTNVFLEIILQQERKEEAKEFLRRVSSRSIFISEFSVDSVGLILFYRNLHDEFLNFIHDVFVHRKIEQIRLFHEELETIVFVSKRFKLDFDDAYQYTAAEKYNLEIVSFDTDFDRTERGRVTPQQVLERINKPQ
ncbi:MAG: type II toxin-antitoxin system VapC family toxin [Ignavibacteriae bacterium]|nr:type II toxin-antitoxin system VapC family toxin [Ignavibacteriota bacterium]